MVRAAVFGAKQVIHARLGGFEPEGVVAIGQDVHLHPERGYVEAMDDVFGDHFEHDGASERHVQLVDFAAALGMLDFPHPLLADDGKFDRVLGHGALFGVQHCTPQEERHRHEQRQNDPDGFEHPQAACCASRAVASGRTTIVEGQKDDRQENQHSEKHADGDQIEVQCIDGRSYRRGLFGK